jgi:hypothetical protein
LLRAFGLRTPKRFRRSGLWRRVGGGCERAEGAGIARRVRVAGPRGERLTQLECRVAHTKFHDLIYLVNESDEEVAFRTEVCDMKILQTGIVIAHLPQD